MHRRQTCKHIEGSGTAYLGGGGGGGRGGLPGGGGDGGRGLGGGGGGGGGLGGGGDGCGGGGLKKTREAKQVEGARCSQRHCISKRFSEHNQSRCLHTMAGRGVVTILWMRKIIRQE